MTEETFTLAKHTYYQPDPNRPAVFVGGQGDKIPMSTAIAVGLVKKPAKPATQPAGGDNSKPADDVEAKAVTAGDVENKALTPASTKATRATSKPAPKK